MFQHGIQIFLISFASTIIYDYLKRKWMVYRLRKRLEAKGYTNITIKWED